METLLKKQAEVSIEMSGLSEQALVEQELGQLFETTLRLELELKAAVKRNL